MHMGVHFLFLSDMIEAISMPNEISSIDRKGSLSILQVCVQQMKVTWKG